MPSPFDRALADLDAPDQKPQPLPTTPGPAGFARALADLDAPEPEPQYQPVLSGVGESFKSAGRSLYQTLIAGPALVEAAARSVIPGAGTQPSPNTPLGTYQEMQRREAEVQAARQSYDRRPGVSGVLQRSLESAVESAPQMAMPIKAGAAVKLSQLLTPEAQALARLATTSGITGLQTTTQEMQQDPRLEHLPYALGQGILEGVMTRLGGATGVEALLKQPQGIQVIREAIKTTAKETGQEMPEEGITSGLQAILSNIERGRPLAEGVPGQITEGSIAGGMMSGAVNAPRIPLALNDALTQASVAGLDEPLIPAAPAGSGDATALPTAMGQQVVQNVALAGRNNADASREMDAETATRQGILDALAVQDDIELAGESAAAARERAAAILAEQDRAQEVARIRNDAMQGLEADKAAQTDLWAEQQQTLEDQTRRDTVRQILDILGPEAGVQGDVDPASIDPLLGMMRDQAVQERDQLSQEAQQAQQVQTDDTWAKLIQTLREGTSYATTDTRGADKTKTWERAVKRGEVKTPEQARAWAQGAAAADVRTDAGTPDQNLGRWENDAATKLRQEAAAPQTEAKPRRALPEIQAALEEATARADRAERAQATLREGLRRLTEVEAPMPELDTPVDPARIRPFRPEAANANATTPGLAPGAVPGSAPTGTDAQTAAKPDAPTGTSAPADTNTQTANSPAAPSRRTQVTALTERVAELERKLDEATNGKQQTIDPLAVPVGTAPTAATESQQRDGVSDAQQEEGQQGRQRPSLLTPGDTSAPQGAGVATSAQQTVDFTPPTTPVEQAPAPVLARLLRFVQVAVPGAPVKIDGDSVLVTLPGGKLVRVVARGIDLDQVNHAAWFDSITANGIQKAIPGLVDLWRKSGMAVPPWLTKPKDGTTLAELRERWLNLPEKTRQAIIAKAMPQAFVTELRTADGKPLPVSTLIGLRDALERPEADVQRDVLEEFYQLGWRLLTETERKAVVADMAKAGRGDLLNRPTTNLAVEEAAAQHLIGWRGRSQRQAVEPRTSGILRRMLDRVRGLLGIAKAAQRAGMPTVDDVGKLVASGKVFERSVGTAAPAETANATPRINAPPSGSLQSEDLRRQWRKATGEPKSQGPTWKDMQEEAAKADEQRGVAYSTPRTINVDGKDRPTENSDGKPIHPTEEGVRNFWRWFGDSDIVDAQGRPIVVYHQTNVQAEQKILGEGFRTDFPLARRSDEQVPNGFFFKPDTSDIKVGTTVDSEKTQIPVYLKITNPLPVDDRNDIDRAISDGKYTDLARSVKNFDHRLAAEFDVMWGKLPSKRMGREGSITEAEWEKFSDEWQSRVDNELPERAAEARARLTQVIRERGYDGMIINRDAGSAKRVTKTFIALDPTQIKSATGNLGAFDPTDPRIAYSTPRNLEREGFQHIRSPKAEVWHRSKALDNALWAAEADGRLPFDQVAELTDTLHDLTALDELDAFAADIKSRFGIEPKPKGPNPITTRSAALGDAPGYSTARNPLQAINDLLPVEQRRTFAQMQAEADEINRSRTRTDAMVAKARAGEGLSDAEQVALRRMASAQYAEAASTGNSNRWLEVGETVLLRKRAGSRVAQELTSRRLDLSTPDGRAELFRSHAMEFGDRWAKDYAAADNATERKAVLDRWAKQQERISKTLIKDYGIDLSDPTLGETFDDAYSVGRLMDVISDIKGEEFHLGQLVSYYTIGNLLTLGSVAVNMTGYPMMLGIQGAKAATAGTIKLLTRQTGNTRLTSLGGAAKAAQAGLAAVGEGLRNGALAYWTGRPQASKAARPMSSYEESDKGRSPIRNPFLRTLVGPALEANRFVDEVAWTMGYRGALAAAAMEKKIAGDPRDLDVIQKQPDADMIEHASAWADWFTLRNDPKSEAGKKMMGAVKALRNPTAGEGIFPGGRFYYVNPLFFLSPFFHAIANLTVEGAKLSPYGAVAGAFATGNRLRKAATTDNKDVRNEAVRGASSSLAYVLAAGALFALANVGGDDDEPFVTGSPDLNNGTPGEAAIKRALHPTRTIGGLDYSRYDPGALPLSMHADLRDAIKAVEAGKDVGDALVGLGEKAFSAAIQRQFLQGIADLFRKQYEVDPETGKSVEKGIASKYTDNVSNMLMLGRGVASSYRRVTQTERQESGRTTSERAYGSGRPAINALGETEQMDLQGVAALFGTPMGKPSPEAKRWMRLLDDANQAVRKAGGDTWYPSPVAGKIGERRLTPEERNAMSIEVGQTWKTMLERQGSRLENMKPEQRLALMKALRERASASAKATVLREERRAR